MTILLIRKHLPSQMNINSGRHFYKICLNFSTIHIHNHKLILNHEIPHTSLKKVKYNFGHHSLKSELYIKQCNIKTQCYTREEVCVASTIHTPLSGAKLKMITEKKE